MSLNDYILDSMGRGFSASADYFLDESRSAMAAVKDKKLEVKAAVQKMLHNEAAQTARYQEMLAKGCSLRGPGEALNAYKKYKGKLNEWRGTLKANECVAKRLVPIGSSADASGAAAKKPIEIDGDFVDQLLLSYENCAFPSSVLDEFFGNVGVNRLKPGEVFPPARR